MQHFFYEATGNKFIIVPLWLNKSFVQSVDYEDADLRRDLISLADGQSVDSVLVLAGNPDSGVPVSMDVFEPRGSDVSQKGGSWSTMCGNGIRAVSQFFYDREIFPRDSVIRIKTRAGVLSVERDENEDWVVQMGYATFGRGDLKNYLSHRAFVNFPADLSGIVLPGHENSGQWDLGFTSFASGDSFKDGEPHLVRETVPDLSLEQLREVTQKIGGCVANDLSLFPCEVNVNIFSRIKEANGCLKINLCTYERGVYYVTSSCGTGNTMVGASLLRNQKNKAFRSVEIHNAGGVLEIASDEDGCMLMRGAARRSGEC